MTETELSKVVPTYIPQEVKEHELSGIVKYCVMSTGVYELMFEVPEY